MKLRVHGIRMAVLTNLIPREKIFQGVIFQIDNIHGKVGNFWFQGKIDFLDQKVEILPPPKTLYPEMFDVKYNYAIKQEAKSFCKHMLEKETNWFRIVELLDEAFQGLHAFTTKDQKHQITLVFAG